jgi:ABC-type glycerol-3-phosphate transport system permease component
MTTTTVSAAPSNLNPETLRRVRVTVTVIVAYVVLIIGALAMVMPFIFSIANSVKTFRTLVPTRCCCTRRKALAFLDTDKF